MNCANCGHTQGEHYLREGLCLSFADDRSCRCAKFQPEYLTIVATSNTAPQPAKTCPTCGRAE